MYDDFNVRAKRIPAELFTATHIRMHPYRGWAKEEGRIVRRFGGRYCECIVAEFPNDRERLLAWRGKVPNSWNSRVHDWDDVDLWAE